jgi:hypothetical protein
MLIHVINTLFVKIQQVFEEYCGHLWSGDYEVEFLNVKHGSM